MLKVGITGGIGSGKTTVCQVFETLGIPVLYADKTARYLMEKDAILINGIKMLFGENIYQGGVLDREQVSSIVFRRPDILTELNKLVHPAVIRYGEQWMESQDTPYIIKEAAIFFESGSFKDMHLMVGVYAPQQLRILRTMERDGISQEKVLSRMAQQMNDEEKMKLCDHIITNDDIVPIIPQVLHLHQLFLQQATQA
ncbi:dephospho-CoA kinase [Polluticoccus soli]|uniref:dephospho-CoA kinase n=1 Tax=Polluticoccus soli TaxID=3034150 RepID=UPI0023E31E3B|nr:dephospho-CoA kinase [Flavipsychrobacter sp. JY13-12]